MTAGAGSRLSGKALLRAALILACAVVFFAFAADDATASAWALLAMNALLGVFFTAAGILLLRRRSAGTGQDRTSHGGTSHGGTSHGGTGQDRTGHGGTGQDRTSHGGTGQDRTGQAEKPGDLPG